jgi:hypothetical protein
MTVCRDDMAVELAWGASACYGLGFMRVSVRLLVLIPALTAACGTGAAPDNELGLSHGQVVGGYVDEKTTGVVGLAIDFGGHPFVGFCSGSLIAPNLVLTAHHCVALLNGSPGGERVICGRTTFQEVGQGSYFLVSPSTVRPSTAADPRFFRGVDVRVAPGGDTDVCGHDVALIILRDPIPARLAKPIVPRIDSTPAPSEVFSADGFGLTEPDADIGGGTRMRLDGNVVSCTGVDCPFGSGVQDTEWASNARTCSGDSGGPALDDQGRVMGVLSRGPDACEGAIYSDVAGFADFIIPIAREAAAQGGYPAPFWTNGSSIPPPPPPDAGPANPDTQCASSDDCGGGLVCYAASGKPPGVCVSHCGTGDACQPGFTCNRAVGVCLRTPAPPPGDDGGCSVSPGSPAGTTGFGWGASLVVGLVAAVRGLRRVRKRRA